MREHGRRDRMRTRIERQTLCSRGCPLYKRLPSALQGRSGLCCSSCRKPSRAVQARAAFQCGANQTGTPIRPPVADYCVSFSANACGGEVIVCRTSRCCSSVRHFITTQWWPLSPRMEVPKGTYIRASVCKSRMPVAAQAQAVLNAPWDSPHLAAPGVRQRRRIMGASGGRR